MIVSDTTPLLHLARAGHLDLLPRLYARIVIPPSVWEEAQLPGEARPESDILEEAKGAWIAIRSLSPRDRRKSESLRRAAPVGRGEADAIALAEALEVAVLMDDRVAVDLARMRGVETRWTTSVVLEAFRRGVLDRMAARGVVEDLVASGLWIRQDVLLRILAILSQA